METFHKKDSDHINCKGCTDNEDKWGKPLVFWTAKIGEKIRLKNISLYGKYNLSAWTHLEVVAIRNEWYRCKQTSTGREETYEPVIDKSDVETPMYWRIQYKVTATSEQEALKILEWLDNRGGVCVWGSLDLGTAGRTMFTPGDKHEEKPHWSMELVEIVTQRERLDIGYEIESSKKPDKSEKNLWEYDRRSRAWYRRISMETSHGVAQAQ